MARRALGWGVRDLERVAKTSTDTISRLERGEVLKERTLDAIWSAFEAAGVEFLPDNGVRLRVSAQVVAKPPGSGSGGSRQPASVGKSAARPPKAPAPKA